MDYKKVLEQYNAIAAAKGKDKHPIILEYLEDPDFLKVTTYILDSSKTFKMGKVKMQAGSIDHDLFEYLDYLDNRPGATKNDKEEIALIASESPEKLEIVNKILRHKTDAGFTVSTVEKLSPGLIPYFPYMRCKGISHLKNIKFPCFSQLKADGMYHEVEDGNYRTRNGKPLDFSLVPEENKANYSGILMGECLMLKEDGSGFMNRRDGNAIINKAQHSGLSQEEADRIRFQYWSIKYGDALAKYYERWEALMLLGVPLISCKVVRDIDEAWDHYEEERAMGLEGTILKNFDGIWKDGTSSDQIKLKAVLECELEVIGTTEGEDKYEGMVGALVCRSLCGKLITNIGMGLSDEDREKDDWVGQHITVAFNEVSKSKAKDTYALSHARLVEPRGDKTEADTLDYILNLREAKRK